MSRLITFVPTHPSALDVTQDDDPPPQCPDEVCRRPGSGADIHESRGVLRSATTFDTDERDCIIRGIAHGDAECAATDVTPAS